MDKLVKIYSRKSNGISVKVWNDSGVDWMIQDSERTTAYPIKTFTMKRAIKFHGELFGVKND
jgi:hypothetical protein